MVGAATALSEIGQDEIEMTPLEKAQSYDGRMRDLEKQISQTWIEAGQIGLYMRNSKGWEILGFHSFNAWVMDAAPKSRSVVLAAVNALEELKDIPIEQLKDIAHTTAHALKKVPRNLRSDPQVIDAAKGMTTRQFVRKMNQEHPTLHLSEYGSRKFQWSKEEEGDISDAIEKAKEEFDVPTEDLAIWAICVDYLQS